MQLKFWFKLNLSPDNELFITLVLLKNVFSLYHLSWLFTIPVSTVSRHLTYWVNFLYFKLGSIPIWPSKKEALKIMWTSLKKLTPIQDVILIALNHYCQVIINFVNQNMAKSSTASGLVACQEDVWNIVVYQNVDIQGIINLGTKHI